MNATRRQPVKALAPAPVAVAKQAVVEANRKAASKAALKKALKPIESILKTPTVEVDRRQDPETAAARAAEYAKNALAAATEDSRITDIPVVQILADMGLDDNGYPLPTAKAGTDRPTYTGPMLALRERTKAGAYIKGANGNPHIADELGVLCGQYSREVVVQGLIRALQLEHNPYAHLNPGQQSMNLRNKARANLKAGTLTINTVAGALLLANSANKH